MALCISVYSTLIIVGKGVENMNKRTRLLSVALLLTILMGLVGPMSVYDAYPEPQAKPRRNLKQRSLQKQTQRQLIH